MTQFIFFYYASDFKSEQPHEYSYSESKMQTQQDTMNSGMISCKMIKVRNTDILNDLLVSIEDVFAVYTAALEAFVV